MNSQLADAMRLVSVRRGIDLSPFTLLVGGGAGPIQSGRLAEALGMRRVIVPRHPGVFCALGLMQASVTHNAVRTYATTAETVDLERLSALYTEMEDVLTRNLRDEGIPRERIGLARFIDAGYIGQGYEVSGLRGRDSRSVRPAAHAGAHLRPRGQLRGCPREAVPLPDGRLPDGVRQLPGGGNRPG